MTTLIRQYQRMTVKLQVLAIKSELKVAMRYENSKIVAMRCKNRSYVKFKTYHTKRVLQKIALLYHKVFE